ncbi:MAG: hypothetical protein Ct9H300mP19_12940 [Dehalococcoidia bacterium]|nr:MAG: hypothetical protein Ct9H300mP19_12940 [Dehalococcoidia bacterium]
MGRVGTESYGSQPGRFFSPHGVAVDSAGNIYVAEVSIAIWTDLGCFGRTAFNAEDGEIDLIVPDVCPGFDQIFWGLFKP